MAAYFTGLVNRLNEWAYLNLLELCLIYIKLSVLSVLVTVVGIVSYLGFCISIKIGDFILMSKSITTLHSCRMNYCKSDSECLTPVMHCIKDVEFI